MKSYPEVINKLRICILTETFFPPDMGGQQLYTSRLAQRLSEKGLKVSVITRKINPNLKSYEKIGKVPVQRISPYGVLKGKGWNAFIPIMILIIKMFFLLVKNIYKYDIFLVISFKVLSIPAVIVKSVFGKKCIIAVVSTSELREDILSDESLSKMKIKRSSIIVKLIRLIRNPIIKRTDYFVGLTAEIEEQFLKLGIDPQKICTIPNGVDLEKFSTVSNEIKMSLRKKLTLPENKIIFCFVGRIVRTKGIMLLINVWKEIFHKYNNVYLLFVGSGKDSYDDCESELCGFIHEHNMNENVFITGNVLNVDEYLKASDVFVFPSDYEGFGLAIIEALACELPAIVTKVGVANDLISDYKNGISININNKEELQNAVEWILQNRSHWNEMGRSARESVGEYTENAETDNYIKLFKEVYKK